MAKEYEVVVALLIALLIIIFGLSLMYGFGSPLVKALFGINMTSTLQSQASPSASINFLQFVKEYKDCNAMPDDNCFCPVSLFPLEKNTFVEINNNNGLTAFNYYSGTPSSKGNFIDGCAPPKNPKPGEVPKGCVEGSDFVVSTNLFVPTKIPGTLTTYLDNGDAFDISTYKTDNPIYLTPYETTTLSKLNFLTSSQYLTPLQVTESSNFNFNLKKLYKKDNKIYLVPASDSRISNTQREAELQKIKQCTKADNFDNAMKVFQAFKTSIEGCLSPSSKPISGKNLCISFASSQIPKAYSITIKKETPNLVLSLGSRIIQPFSLSNFIIINDNDNQIDIPIILSSDNANQVYVYNTQDGKLAFQSRTNTDQASTQAQEIAKAISNK